MKKVFILSITVGLIFLTGVFFITVFSDSLPEFVNTIIFVLAGYLGLGFFAWGFMKRISKPD